MGASKKFGLITGILTLVAIICVFLYLRMHVLQTSDLDIAEEVPSYEWDAGTMLNLFARNGGDYIDAESIVLIEGVIKEINYLNNRTTIILEGNTKQSSHVICDMQTNQKDAISMFSSKDTITLKGVYKGFLKDAIFLNCIITK